MKIIWRCLFKTGDDNNDGFFKLVVCKCELKLSLFNYFTSIKQIKHFFKTFLPILQFDLYFFEQKIWYDLNETKILDCYIAQLVVYCYCSFDPQLQVLHIQKKIISFTFICCPCTCWTTSEQSHWNTLFLYKRTLVHMQLLHALFF